MRYLGSTLVGGDAYEEADIKRGQPLVCGCQFVCSLSKEFLTPDMSKIKCFAGRARTFILPSLTNDVFGQRRAGPAGMHQLCLS